MKILLDSKEVTKTGFDGGPNIMGIGSRRRQTKAYYIHNHGVDESKT